GAVVRCSGCGVVFANRVAESVCDKNLSVTGYGCEAKRGNYSRKKNERREFEDFERGVGFHGIVIAWAFLETRNSLYESRWLEFEEQRALASIIIFINFHRIL